MPRSVSSELAFQFRRDLELGRRDLPVYSTCPSFRA
jgi:hypothetical protein